MFLSIVSFCRFYVGVENSSTRKDFSRAHRPRYDPLCSSVCCAIYPTIPGLPSMIDLQTLVTYPSPSHSDAAPENPQSPPTPRNFDASGCHYPSPISCARVSVDKVFQIANPRYLPFLSGIQHLVEGAWIARPIGASGELVASASASIPTHFLPPVSFL